MGLRVKYGSKIKTEDTIRCGNMEVVGDFYDDVWGSQLLRVLQEFSRDGRKE